jgi:ribosomal protein RSM22 (predicted rRNA methylase)
MRDIYATLSSRYKQQKSHLHTDEMRFAYVAARLPATKAVIGTIIERLFAEKNPIPPKSVLDLGSGPGTAILALEDILSDPINATLIERDQGFIDISKTLLQNEYAHIKGDILRVDYTPHDWVIASYSLNELPKEKHHDFITSAFDAANSLLILIEPGTPQGFKNILKARQTLIKADANILLPCSHSLKCPLEETPIWCHFSKRLTRTKQHKTTKGGTLGYEDEKYCYLIASKSSFARSPRIISTPKQHSGHIQISTCGLSGNIEITTFSKSKSENFKEMKKKEWGDVL